MVISGTSWYWGTIWLGKALYLACSWFTFTFMIIAFTPKAAAEKTSGQASESDQSLRLMYQRQIFSTYQNYLKDDFWIFE